VEIEIGYRLARAFWGRGLAAEAARAVRDYALGVLALPRLVAIIDPCNRASIPVAQKCGRRYVKDELFPENVCKLYVVHHIGYSSRPPPSRFLGVPRSLDGGHC
jgi:RimJ/RimL family protein N-acetyltransferase